MTMPPDNTKTNPIAAPVKGGEVSAHGPERHMARRNEMTASEDKAEVARPSQIGRF
ncbi:MAG: hypothetical protein WB764_29280 [Xanthobacteraceae bacterium]